MLIYIPISNQVKIYEHIHFNLLWSFIPFGGFIHSLIGKESASNAETWVRSLGWEDPLEKGKATQSSILAWRIPCTV